MTHSMTAFSRVQSQYGTSVLCWELKSVNHRYLDASFRLPETFRFLENNLRNILRGQLNRGKLECQFKFTDTCGDNQSISLNDSLVDALLDVGSKLAASRHLANDLTVSYLLSWPGVIEAGSMDMENLYLQAEQLFQEALTELSATRLVEGNVLKEYIKSRLYQLQEEVSSARITVGATPGNARDKLLARLQTLQVEVDNTRLEQEIAILLTKLDVSEELDRLQSHLDEVFRTLDRDEAVGRRLDFLMQEMNREANTLSSKSDSVALTQSAVQMKVLTEQMREQIQNIE